MKVAFELKPIQLVIGIGVIAFLLLSFMQYKRNSGLKEDIKNSKIVVEKLESENEALNNNIVFIKKEKDSIIAKVEDLVIEKKYYKNKYFVTNAKLKKIIVDYNSASSIDKNKLFTDAINN